MTTPLRIPCSWPQAARLLAVAAAGGVPVERAVTRHGRSTSARRELLTLCAADADAVVRGLAAWAAHLRDAGRRREADETLGAARLVTAAMTPREEAA